MKEYDIFNVIIIYLSFLMTMKRKDVRFINLYLIENLNFNCNSNFQNLCKCMVLTLINMSRKTIGIILAL